MSDIIFKNCLFDFFYFAENYIKVQDPIKGLINFNKYPYLDRVFTACNKNDFTILKKFRQAGMTTSMLAWVTWKCMFNLDQKVLWITRNDRQSIEASRIVRNFIRNLPEWLAPVMGKDNDHYKSFIDSGSAIFFANPAASRSKAANIVVIDDSAFITKMDTWWKAIYPTIQGKCIVMSSPNGRGNWFEQTYTGSLNGDNNFHAIDINYMEHPIYSKPE
jgi:hypothetical protein